MIKKKKFIIKRMTFVKNSNIPSPTYIYIHLYIYPIIHSAQIGSGLNYIFLYVNCNIQEGHYLLF